MTRVHVVGLFFALIVVGLLSYYGYLHQNVFPKVKQCRGDFVLPEHGYWKTECWWECEKGWVRHVLNSTCEIDKYKQD